MAGTPRGRKVFVNQLVYDQADYFAADGFTRIVGLTYVDVTLELFFNNQPMPWTLAPGADIVDNQVAAGRVYFHEITTEPGHYNVRFRPNAAGYWRLLVTYPVGQQRLAQDFDVEVPTTQGPAPGLRASFVKPA